TMLYGHIEEPRHRIDHLVRLRELQDETGGFQTFIPLAFHPDNTRLGDEQKIVKPGILTDLRVMALGRLMLDNFPHVKAYWVMLGIQTAQVALSFGADDLDGTVVHEKIYHDAGSDSPQELSVAEIRRLIEEAGRVPVERDTLYRRVEERVDEMVAAGVREEVRAAHAAGASETARQAVGFDELLAGDLEAMKRRTRNLVKRQLTWMRKLAGVEVIDTTGREPVGVAAEVHRLASTLPRP
ncbi:MAG: hypothetical protein M3141_06610, partial [Actinomycetota bacterium]|nr:hypothetical protein [Actinomycetota bacterium]